MLGRSSQVVRFWQLLLFFFFKVIVETALESFCFTSNTFVKSEEKSEKESKVGIVQRSWNSGWGFHEEVCREGDFLEVKLHMNGGHSCRPFWDNFPPPHFQFLLRTSSSSIVKWWGSLGVKWILPDLSKLKKSTERRYGFESKGELTKCEIVGDYIKLGCLQVELCAAEGPWRQGAGTLTPHNGVSQVGFKCLHVMPSP